MIKAACVQLLMRRHESKEDFLLRLNYLVETALTNKVKLVVFPAYTFFAYLTLTYPELPLYFGPGFAKAIKIIWSSYAARCLNEFLEFFKKLSRQYEVHISPGTMLIPSGKGIKNTAYLISPAGKIIGTQAGTHLNRDELGSGYIQEDDLHIFNTSLGNLGFTVCEDPWYPEVMRILSLKNAEIIIAPLAVPKPYNKWHQKKGMWQNIHENQVFAIESCVVGFLGGAEFEGRSKIYAPCKMTVDGTGVLAQAKATHMEDVIVANLDLNKLRCIIKTHNLKKLNAKLHKTWFPCAYNNYRHTV